MAALALDGVKVLELCQMVAGPYCAKVLADLGADVLKIEPPVTGDEARRQGPFLRDVPNAETSGLFLYCNTNKRGVTLDLSTSTGRSIFLRLIESVDIFIEDTTPGTLDKWDVPIERLRAANPRLVVTSITPFGQNGPHSGYKAYHLNTFHASMVGFLTPGGSVYPDRPPIKQGLWVGDYASGVTASIATLGALYRQRATGQGQHIDASKQEMLLHLESMEVLRYPNDGIQSDRFTRGYRVGGVFPCKDGYVEIALQEEAQWSGLVRAMGSPAWANDEKCKDRNSRETHGPELNKLITAWTNSMGRDEVCLRCQKERVTAAPYLKLNEVVESAQMKHRNFFQELEHPVAGKVRYPTAPYKFSRTPWSGRRPPPTLGQHNEEVYCDQLGFSREDLAALGRAGII